MAAVVVTVARSMAVVVKLVPMLLLGGMDVVQGKRGRKSICGGVLGISLLVLGVVV